MTDGTELAGRAGKKGGRLKVSFDFGFCLRRSNNTQELSLFLSLDCRIVASTGSRDGKSDWALMTSGGDERSADPHLAPPV